MAQTVVEALSSAHEVTVVCGRPSYEPTERRAWRLWETEKASESQQRSGVKIIRVGSTDYSRTEMWRRVLNYLTYVALSVPRASFVPCDVVLGMTDPPFEGIVAAVAVVRDGAEICEAGSEHLVDAEVVRAIRGDFKFVLLHAGNLGFYGAWETLLSAARKLADEGIGLVFVGDGAQRAQIETAAAGCKNVRFLPFFPASKIASVLSAPDAHIVTIKRGLEGVIVPSKMYGILAAGKPIVAVAPRETDVAAMGEKRGFALWGDPDDAEQVACAVRELLRDGNQIRHMGEAARMAANEYDKVKELRKFVRIIEEARPA